MLSRRTHMFALFFVLCITLLSFGQLYAQEIIGPETYPDGIDPLNGLPVDDPGVLERRPLIVKISNYPPIVRPQSGLNEAEIVWEHLLAGGVTRFAAVFLASDLDHVGPIRSSRLIDFQLVRLYNGLFVYSGMAEGTLDRLRTDGYATDHAIGGGGPCPALCRFPREGLALEHTLFGNLPALRDLAVELERDTTFAPNSGMAFSETAPSGGIGLDGIVVDYRQTQIEWDYDSEASVWRRSQDGEPQSDAVTGSQITAANIVVLEANHIEQPVVYDGYWGPPNFAFDVELVGSGRIFFLRDGQYWEGEWRRESDSAPLYFVDKAGNNLPFRPGNTFVNLVPRWVGGYGLTFFLRNPLTATVSFQGGANMRLGPSQEFASPDVAYSGDTFRAVGRNRSGDWVQVLLSDDTPLWLSLEVVSLDGDIMSLPLVRTTVD